MPSSVLRPVENSPCNVRPSTLARRRACSPSERPLCGHFAPLSAASTFLYLRVFFEVRTVTCLTSLKARSRKHARVFLTGTEGRAARPGASGPESCHPEADLIEPRPGLPGKTTS